jgi:integration host factor subunit alpha|tara:strand:- start:188 stop:502 length:315 start_codon:yes stop_codon:yes gene_type:complete
MPLTVNRRKNIKKKDIINNIFLNIGIPSVYSAKVVNDIINILILNIKKYKKLKIKNFGSFSLQNKKKRIGRNPKNNDPYEISERIVVSFKMSKNLEKKINKNEQ